MKLTNKQILNSLRRGKASSWIGWIADPINLDKELEQFETLCKNGRGNEVNNSV